MAIVVEKGGILTTIQDSGRTGYRASGINVNGPMDRAAATVANVLAGGEQDEAVLEIHYPGPVLRFEEDVTFAIAGADLGCTVNGDPTANWSSRTGTSSSTVRFTQKRSGNRAYLAVAGGFEVQPWLGSRSTNLTANVGGHMGRRVLDGDRLELRRPTVAAHTVRAAPALIPRYGSFPTVRVIMGDHFTQLTADGRAALFEETFEISQDANRMGFRLKGAPLERLGAETISSSVAFGTVQLLPDGQLIVLMADHQTSGGYPRVAHIITRDLPLVGQLATGDKVAFHLVSIEEAERLALEFSRELNFLKVGCRLLASS